MAKAPETSTGLGKAVKDWTFLLGPGFIVGWENGLILSYLMYSSRLVPRKWPG